MVNNYYKTIQLEIPEGADINDDAVLWRAWRGYWKEKRRNNLQYWEEHGKAQIAELVGSEVTRFSEYHFAIFIHGDRMDIWPSSRKWRYKGKPSQGDFPAMFSFIKNRLKEGNK